MVNTKKYFIALFVACLFTELINYFSGGKIVFLIHLILGGMTLMLLCGLLYFVVISHVEGRGKPLFPLLDMFLLVGAVIIKFML